MVRRALAVKPPVAPGERPHGLPAARGTWCGGHWRSSRQWHPAAHARLEPFMMRQLLLCVTLAFGCWVLSSCGEAEKPMTSSTSSSGTVATEDGVSYGFIYYEFQFDQERRPGPLVLWPKSTGTWPRLGFGTEGGRTFSVRFKDAPERYQVASTSVVLVRSRETQPEVLADTWDPRVADTDDGFSRFVTRLLDRPTSGSNQSPE